MPDTFTPTDLAKAADISLPYASQLLGGKRPWPVMLSIKTYRATGRRFGPIIGATDNDIDVLARFTPETRAVA